MSGEKVDSLVGQELMRISVETFEIHLQFPDSQIQIGSDFLIRDGEQILERLSPTKRVGNIGVLWSTIGNKVTKLAWADSTLDSMVVAFGNGIIVEISPFPGRPRGTILGFYEGKHTVDDF